MPRVDHLRQDYERGTFSRSQLEESPYAQFLVWLALALDSDVPEPTAMTLATCSADGQPSARIVLLKGHDEEGLVFYTNYGSRKARELDAVGKASLCFFWQPLQRQVRVEGGVRRLEAEESDSYFASRPRDSQIGAWASPQSQPLPGRAALDELVRRLERRFPEGQRVERPDFWGGYRLRPHRWEFWQGRRSRLHDRFEYVADGDGWAIRRLGP